MRMGLKSLLELVIVGAVCIREEVGVELWIHSRTARNCDNRREKSSGGELTIERSSYLYSIHAYR